jgi:hypothetical protein
LQLSELQHQPVTYEIIGDLFVDFHLTNSDDNRSKANHDKAASKPEVGQQKPEVFQNRLPANPPREKIVLASKGSSKTLRPGQSTDCRL